jgi:DNA-binding NtrC family response regulator
MIRPRSDEAALTGARRGLTGDRSDIAVTCEEFLGMPAVIASESMDRLLALAARVARSNAPVLITGESGTGKELIARAVHQFSSRSTRQFIDVNCAALSENLIDCEFFGCEKGAFRGAEYTRPGLFEIADGGTLFLDEIGELDSRMQAKLLRVLDGHSFFRVGGSEKVEADVRVVATTSLKLQAAVQSGRFREDLFHRLNAFQLRVPPLRDRPEDIAPLARFFLNDSGFSLSAEALTMLEGYSWPGNVRELRNALMRAVLFAEGDVITPGDLRIEVICEPGIGVVEEYSLNGLTQQTIFKVMEQTGGHQQKAADMPGISRRTLIRKLKLYRSPDDGIQEDFA